MVRDMGGAVNPYLLGGGGGGDGEGLYGRLPLSSHLLSAGQLDQQNGGGVGW